VTDRQTDGQIRRYTRSTRSIAR